MPRTFWRPIVALLALAAFPASSAWAASGDKALGQQRAQACGGCHGSAGVSAMAGVPSLAGQTDGFLQWQLVFFRSGRRSNQVMTAVASGLSDDDVKNVAAYFASLPPPAPSKAETSKAETSKAESGALEGGTLQAAGASLAAEHHCANCHTDAYTGKQAAARIAGQREDYLVHALADYRSGARPSTGVAAMNEAASGLSDDDIAAVSHFLATLK